jgi:hypothetical protein
MSKKKSMAADLINAVEMCTRDWTRTIEKEERNPVSRRYRFERMTRERGIQFKEAAWEIMEEAYNKASGRGAYPANARQIMYAARPYIQQKVGKPLQSAYFTQTLLPSYIEEHGCHHWTTAYDARGHFAEPHGGERFGVGTLEVRDTCAVSVTHHSVKPRSALPASAATDRSTTSVGCSSSKRKDSILCSNLRRSPTAPTLQS